MKPGKISNAEKYRMLGLVSSPDKRALVWLIISNSANGKWTRYEHAKNIGIENPVNRMNELMRIGGIAIGRRMVPGIDCNGNKTQFAEFCVGG